MQNDRRSRARILAALTFAASFAGAAQATPFKVLVQFPQGPRGDAVLFTIRQDGKLLHNGQLGLRHVHATSAGVEFPDNTKTDLSEAGAPYLVLATLNQDELRAFAPSFGDYYQTAVLEKTGNTWGFVLRADEWKKLELTAPDSLLTVHYHRPEKDYPDVSLWTWDEHLRRAPRQNELYPAGWDDFGPIFQIDLGLYGEPGDGVGLLPRLNGDWAQKDGGDRMWQPSLGRTVYLVQDDPQLYTEVPDVSPKVRRVTLDADHHLTVRFSHRLPAAHWTPDKFQLETSAGEQLHVRAVWPFKHRGDDCAVYSIEIAEPLEYPQTAYALTVAGFGTFNVEVGHIVTDPNRFYDPDAKLGADYSPQHTTFRVFAPGALAADVIIADAPAGADGLTRHPLTDEGKGLWSATIDGDLAGKFYAYALRGIGFDPDLEITDPYATCTQGRARRALIVDLAATDPPGFRDDKYHGPTSPADAIIYELHVRDFTIAASSGAEHKGKYLGLTEAGTTLPDDPAIKTGLDHLVELGVTHVQIMPVQDYDNTEDGRDSYNWGYMTVFFNSPEGVYASRTAGPAKVRELKAAIQAFHDRGIGVILDVVYNHTAGWAPFEQLVPGYYHRLTDAGNLSNGSGCGNEFASENPMARKYILDSVKFWVEQYQIDGFRFDLMGLIDLETMKQIEAELRKRHPGILIYGEPWTGGPTPLKPVTDKHQVRGTGIGAFNDGFRDAIKGDRDGGAPGFIQNGDRVDGVVKGLMGAVHDWAQDPTDSVNYFEAHDNLTCWDKLLRTTPDDDALRRRMMRFAALTLFTAQGVPFIHSGQEMCRTKKGSHNSYNLGDEYNAIDWQRKQTYADVLDYHKGLIALRKAHPAFRLRTRAQVEQRVAFLTPPDHRNIEYHIDAAGLDGETAEKIIVLLNGAPDAVTFDLPDGRWNIHADADRASLQPLGEAAERITVAPHSGVLLIR